jgi:hypothetical protein
MEAGFINYYAFIKGGVKTRPDLSKNQLLVTEFKTILQTF